MSWSACFAHATTSVLSYVAFLAAGIGGGAYLFVEWYRPLRDLENFREEMQLYRLRTNFAYMSIGIILLGTGIVLGSLRANELWHSYWPLGAKQNFTLITWVYYVVATGFLVAHFQRPEKSYAKISAALAIGGIPLILINGLAVNYFIPGLHKYLFSGFMGS